MFGGQAHHILPPSIAPPFPSPLCPGTASVRSPVGTMPPKGGEILGPPGWQPRSRHNPYFARYGYGSAIRREAKHAWRRFNQDRGLLLLCCSFVSLY